jgi:hypothetical protein
MLNFFLQKVHFFKNQNFVKEIKESFQVPMNILFLHRIFKINLLFHKHVLKLPIYYVTHFVKNTFEAEERACNGS